MGAVAMKKRGRAKRVKRVSTDIVMIEDQVETSGHEKFKQQAAERREVKSRIAQLKEQRKKLGKKQRDAKKTLSKEIKLLLSQIPH